MQLMRLCRHVSALIGSDSFHNDSLPFESEWQIEAMFNVVEVHIKTNYAVHHVLTYLLAFDPSIHKGNNENHSM